MPLKILLDNYRCIKVIDKNISVLNQGSFHRGKGYKLFIYDNFCVLRWNFYSQWRHLQILTRIMKTWKTNWYWNPLLIAILIPGPQSLLKSRLASRLLVSQPCVMNNHSVNMWYLIRLLLSFFDGNFFSILDGHPSHTVAQMVPKMGDTSPSTVWVETFWGDGGKWIQKDFEAAFRWSKGRCFHIEENNIYLIINCKFLDFVIWEPFKIQIQHINSSYVHRTRSVVS